MGKKYRVLKPLSTGQRPGDVIDEAALARRAIPILVKVGAISPVSYPPIRVLSGWDDRAERLKAIEIEDVGEFLDADTGALAEQLAEEPEAVEALKAEAAEAVKITEKKKSESPRKGCTGCSGRD